MKFLITGHTSGIGKAIFDKFGGIGLSRQTLFDISKHDIKPYVKQCDIFINNAYDDRHPWAQTNLVYEAKEIKQIVIGSNTTDQTKYEPHPYQSAKLALENSCNQLFYQGYDITLIKLGWVDTQRVREVVCKKINVDYVVSLIEWILKQPHRIKEITVVPYS
jgi:hypothetical protein